MYTNYRGFPVFFDETGSSGVHKIDNACVFVDYITYSEVLPFGIYDFMVTYYLIQIDFAHAQ